MGMKIHERDLRGQTHMGWLDSRHTFSFGHFMDPHRMGFRALRVINDDRVIGGGGFGEHPHDNMEIVSIVLDGALEHGDSTGTRGIIRPGEVQKMSAGKGIVHSEYNASKDKDVHFLQIWIVPDQRDIEPAYEQVAINESKARENFTLIGAPEASPENVVLHQDVRMYWATPEEGQNLSYRFEKSRHGFLHVAAGQIEIEDAVLKEGDALQMSDVEAFDLNVQASARLLLFDLA